MEGSAGNAALYVGRYQLIIFKQTLISLAFYL